MTTSPTEMSLAAASGTLFIRQTSTAITTSVLTFPTHAQAAPRLSPSAIMGIGVAAGVIGILTLMTSGLLIYRCWKRRQSPEVRYYRQARLWKGFTPATPSTARTTLTESKMANIYFGELRSPATPAFIFSPPLGRAGQSWPDTPLEGRSPPAERSV
ncbi:hypothetical protein FB567DRAFT_529264 [Paraphoma chrysanthemicola]|uniref:Uncharacterized protein n=1 Tax=Paraphoma chrysanthemicola TaxID=798071 RepID=A0A8K0R339_9PLEO|nr:hypothetical protein FB567DRAFT_529264 [Paraphoma chrysanthemicola]